MADLRSKYEHLETEHVQLRSENADLKAENAELRRWKAGAEARIERVEQGKADKPLALDPYRALGEQGVAVKDSRHQLRRRLLRSNEAIGVGAAAGTTILTTVPDIWSCVSATYAGIAVSALGFGAATVAFIRKRREVKDAAHRPEN